MIFFLFLPTQISELDPPVATVRIRPVTNMTYHHMSDTLSLRREYVTTCPVTFSHIGNASTDRREIDDVRPPVGITLIWWRDNRGDMLPFLSMGRWPVCISAEI